MRYHVVVAAAIVSAAFVAGVGPAGASLTHNALVPNALEASGSPLEELNGVTVEAVVRAEAEAEARGDNKSGHGSDGAGVVADGDNNGPIHVGGAW